MGLKTTVPVTVLLRTPVDSMSTDGLVVASGAIAIAQIASCKVPRVLRSVHVRIECLARHVSPWATIA
jgi:hypothetical protein